MSTTATPATPTKKEAPKTAQQKRIIELEALKAKATEKNPMPEALRQELKTLIAAEKKLTLARLANGRVNKLVDLMRQIGNLGAYKPSQKQTKMTFDVIKKAVEAAELKWDSSAEVSEDSFTLPTE